MENKIKREIEEFHVWCEGWIAGNLPREDFHRFTSVMDEKFEMITVTGVRANLEEMTAVISNIYNSGSRKIWVENIEIKQCNDTWTANYHECHEENGVSTRRATTTVFVPDSDQINGVRWLHCDENWVTPPVEGSSTSKILGDFEVFR